LAKGQGLNEGLNTYEANSSVPVVDLNPPPVVDK